jgi:hypothetical protein
VRAAHPARPRQHCRHALACFDQVSARSPRDSELYKFHAPYWRTTLIQALRQTGEDSEGFDRAEENRGPRELHDQSFADRVEYDFGGVVQI